MCVDVCEKRKESKEKGKKKKKRKRRGLLMGWGDECYGGSRRRSFFRCLGRLIERADSLKLRNKKIDFF